MGLYDKKFDWYDVFIPGSTTTAAVMNADTLIRDAADAIGFGTNRRQQEFNASEAEKQRQFEAEQAQIQRDYETQMSNTAVQRQVADMNQAGVNSAMAFAGGASGASTPTGASAKGSSASSAIGNSGIGSILNSASNLINSHTRQLEQNRYSRHLDYKEMQKLDTTTNEIYDSAGKLLRTVLTNKLH